MEESKNQVDAFPYDPERVKAIRTQLKLQLLQTVQTPQSKNTKEKKKKSKVSANSVRNNEKERKLKILSSKEELRSRLQIIMKMGSDVFDRKFKGQDDTEKSEKVIENEDSTKTESGTGTTKVVIESHKNAEKVIKNEDSTKTESGTGTTKVVIESHKNPEKAEEIITNEDNIKTESSTGTIKVILESHKREHRISDIAKKREEYRLKKKEEMSLNEDAFSYNPAIKEEIRRSFQCVDKKESKMDSSKIVQFQTSSQAKDLSAGDSTSFKEDESENADDEEIHEVTDIAKSRLQMILKMGGEIVENHRSTCKNTKKAGETIKKSSRTEKITLPSQEKDSSVRKSTIAQKREELRLKQKQERLSQSDAFPYDPDKVKKALEQARREARSKPERKTIFDFKKDSKKKKLESAPQETETSSEEESSSIEDYVCKKHKEKSTVDKLLPQIPSTEIVAGDADSMQPGFLDDLMREVKAELNELRRKREWSRPQGKPSLEDRMRSLEQADFEINSHFQDADGGKPVKPKKRRSSVVPPTTSSTTTDNLSHLRSQFIPDDDQPDYHRRKQSWVGAYVEGKDYWEKSKDLNDKEKVKFAMDEDQKAWYDWHVISSDEDDDGAKEEKAEKLKSLEKKLISRNRKESMKSQKADYEKDTVLTKDRPRISSAKLDPSPKLMSEFKDMFQQFANLEGTKSKINLPSADKWLEQVGILDYKVVTAIHTGLFFKVAGGSRYRALAFDEFTVFMEMIATLRKMSFIDAINRLKLANVGLPIEKKNKCFCW